MFLHVHVHRVHWCPTPWLGCPTIFPYFILSSIKRVYLYTHMQTRSTFELVNLSFKTHCLGTCMCICVVSWAWWIVQMCHAQLQQSFFSKKVNNTSVFVFWLCFFLLLLLLLLFFYSFSPISSSSRWTNHERVCWPSWRRLLSPSSSQDISLDTPPFLFQLQRSAGHWSQCEHNRGHTSQPWQDRGSTKGDLYLQYDLD